MNQPAQYLEGIIKPLTENPDNVRITETTDEMGLLLSVDLHASDMGRIIGKQGATINAIRTLVKQLGFSQKARISIKLNEPPDRADDDSSDPMNRTMPRY